MVECTRLESEQTFTGLGSSNLPLSEVFAVRRPLLAVVARIAVEERPYRRVLQGIITRDSVGADRTRSRTESH